MEKKIPAPPELNLPKKKEKKEPSMFVGLTTIFILGFLLGMLFCGWVLFQQTAMLLDHVKVESFIFSVNETSIVSAMFKEMDSRGVNFTNLLTNQSGVNISGS
jgi:hypothetical protein